jgi:transposase
MPTPYSYDLRKKAIEAVQRGQQKIQVCRLLKISRNTLDLWLKRAEETGDFRAISGYQKGYREKLKDLESFKQFVLDNGDKTQQQIAELWGDGLTQQNVSYACRKLGITRKKKLMAIKKEMKKNEQNLSKDWKR